MGDNDKRTQRCPRCGQEIERYKGAVPGKDVVFEYFICPTDGFFTATWSRDSWMNGTTDEEKPFINFGYVTDEATAPADAAEGAE